VLAWRVVRKGKDSAGDYFLAGRNLGWWIIGASIFASNIGSEHVVGLAGAGATSGVALAHYELHAWCLLVLGWVFVPFYMRSKVFTMPEFLERRFSTASRYVLSIVSIITFIVSKIAVGIFAGGVVFGTLLLELHLRIGSTQLDSFWIGSVLVIVLTGLYTALGGMRAVAYNDAVQTFVLILGSASLTIYGLVKLGGISEHGLYDYLQAVQGYLAPPIFVVFFFGVFFKRLNAQGALWAMIVGFVLGIFRMLVDTPVTLGLAGFQDGYPQGSFLWIVNNTYFQYFSVLITLVSILVMVGVSYMTSEPDYLRIQNLTFATTTQEDKDATRAGWDWREIAGSTLVLACIIGSYVYFSGSRRHT
jgi:Na+/proline symporter